MPFIGWVAATRFSTLMEQYDHWIAFTLLAFWGGKIIYESSKDEEHHAFNPHSLKVILTTTLAVPAHK